MEQPNNKLFKLMALLGNGDTNNGKSKIDSLHNVLHTIKEQNISCDKEIDKNITILFEKAKKIEEDQIKNAKFSEKWTEIEGYKSEQAAVTILKQKVDEITEKYGEYKEEAKKLIQQSNAELKEFTAVVYNADIEAQILTQELNKLNEIHTDTLQEQANNVKQVEETIAQVLKTQKETMREMDVQKTQLAMKQCEIREKEALQQEITRENHELISAIDEKQKKNLETVQKYSQQHHELNEKIQSLEQMLGDLMQESDRKRASNAEKIRKLRFEQNIFLESKQIVGRIPTQLNDDKLVELGYQLQEKQSELTILQDNSEKHKEQLAELQRYQQQIIETAAIETTYNKYEELILDVESEISAKNSATAEAKINLENIQNAANQKQKKLVDEGKELSKSIATTRNIYIQELKNIMDQVEAKKLTYKERKVAFNNIYHDYKKLKSQYGKVLPTLSSAHKRKIPDNMPINSAPSTSAAIEINESDEVNSQLTSQSSILYINGIPVPTYREVYGSNLKKK